MKYKQYDKAGQPYNTASSWTMIYADDNYYLLLLTAIQLPGNSIKIIASETGIKANTLYKWKTTSVHLSPEKADKLLLYFMEHEPDRLELADAILQLQ